MHCLPLPESIGDDTLYAFQNIMEETAITNAGEFDLANIREEEFELHTTYIVPDMPVEPGTANRAEASLPRNLVLKSSQAFTDVSYRFSLPLHRL